MLVKAPVIDDEARKHINRALEKVFTHKEGEDLDAVVSEVLNDRDIFLYFLTHLRKGQGIELGSMSYWDDAHVDLCYGLAMNYRTEPPKLSLFTYEILGGRTGDLGVYSHFPTFLLKGTDCQIPTAKRFADEVNLVLKSIKQEDAIDLSKIRRYALSPEFL